jgi:hypothetical protein
MTTMNRVIVRNLMFSLFIGVGILSLPKIASACDQKCQCNLAAQQDWMDCLAAVNAPPCNDDCTVPGASCFYQGDNMCQYLAPYPETVCGARLADAHEECDFFD